MYLLQNSLMLLTVSCWWFTRLKFLKSAEAVLWTVHRLTGTTSGTIDDNQGGISQQVQQINMLQLAAYYARLYNSENARPLWYDSLESIIGLSSLYIISQSTASSLSIEHN